MSYLPRNLAERLRAAGLTVVEVDGWQTRGRPASTGGFAPVGVLNHHTGASAKGWSWAKELIYATWMFLTGRLDLPAPLCQIALGRSGRVYLGAAGRANHAGTAKSSGSVSGGDGNYLYAGVEWMLSGTEAIPKKMMKAGITLNAVLTEEFTADGEGTSVETISCHYNTSITGKWDIGDPNGVQFGDKKVLDIRKFRDAVKAERKRLKTPKPRKTKVNVAVINIPKKVGAKAWEQCFRLAAKSSIFGVNESVSREQHLLYAALAEEMGLDHSGLARSANPIFWDRKEFNRIGGGIIQIHEAGCSPLAEKYPGYNSARTINETILKSLGGAHKGKEFAVLNTHLVPNGGKVDPVWRKTVRLQSKQMLRQLAQDHRKEGRIVIPMGDMNIREPFVLGKGMRWLRGVGIDKIGSSHKGTASTFPAPTDHKHGVRAKIVV